MRHRPLPPILEQAVGHLRYLQYQGGNEWSAECLECRDYGHVGNDDPDRMRIWDEDKARGLGPRCWCRRCGFFAFADELVDEPPAYGLSEEAQEKARKERLRLAKKEIERQQEKIKAIEEAAFWRRWHEAMEEEQRQLWHEQGISGYFVDYYKLGYTTHHTYYHDGKQLISPAMTIPHYGHEWQLTNIQYRLMDPADGAGKYRQTAGLPAAMFRTEPDEELEGPVLVVEGAKKAVVCYEHLGLKPLGFRLNIVGVPSKTPGSKILDELDECEPVYIGLDPDAYDTRNSAAERIGDKLGERTRFIHFPDKPDDLIVEYGLSGDDLKKYLRNATRTV